VGHPGAEPPRRPLLRKGRLTVVTLATLGADAAPVWHGLWLDGAAVRPLGPAVPTSSLPFRASASEGARALIDLVEASSLSLVEALESVGARLDALEGEAEPPSIVALSELQRRLARVRKHLFRLELLLGELAGPLGTQFPGVAPALAEFSGGLTRLTELSAGLQQAARDLTALRATVESNRLAEAANALGKTSNAIAALANTSNLRMLGVAYVALALALVSVVVLIPNTAATILGMPSAAWVPGLWVDVALVVLAVVPIVLVFSRPWVRRMLSGWGDFERRSAEGLRDLPEISTRAAERTSGAERLIPPHS
jgi:hypothetical protein